MVATKMLRGTITIGPEINFKINPKDQGDGTQLRAASSAGVGLAEAGWRD